MPKVRGQKTAMAWILITERDQPESRDLFQSFPGYSSLSMRPLEPLNAKAVIA